MKRYWRPNQAFLGPVRRGGKTKCKEGDQQQNDTNETSSEAPPASASNNETAENQPVETPNVSKVPVMTRKAGRRVHFEIEVINNPIKTLNTKEFTPDNDIASQGVTVYDRSSNSLIFSVAPRSVGRSQIALDRIPFSFRFGRR